MPGQEWDVLGAFTERWKVVEQAVALDGMPERKCMKNPLHRSTVPLAVLFSKAKGVPLPLN